LTSLLKVFVTSLEHNY